jgi:hypothetical protein
MSVTDTEIQLVAEIFKETLRLASKNVEFTKILSTIPTFKMESNDIDLEPLNKLQLRNALQKGFQKNTIQSPPDQKLKKEIGKILDNVAHQKLPVDQKKLNQEQLKALRQ